jgi:sortase A
VRRLADMLLIAGGLILAYPFWSAGYAQVQQGRLDDAYRQEATSFVQSAPVDARDRSVPKEQRLRRLAASYRTQLEAGDPIGRLKIPDIGLNRLVLQGASGHGLDPSGDARYLRAGPVHYAVTPLPGAGEPFAVAGHRTTYGAPFYKLDKLDPGAAIFVDTPYARFRYKVAKTSVVRPDDVGVLADRGYDLVLTTCTPLYSASRRLIVWARLAYATPATGKLSP